VAGVGGCSANSCPTWFAEVGPLREGGTEGAPGPLDNVSASAAGRRWDGPKGPERPFRDLGVTRAG